MVRKRWQLLREAVSGTNDNYLTVYTGGNAGLFSALFCRLIMGYIH